ncbi:MAG TPA: hypothetical protein VHS96_07785 [Bacteroidia bacterium]|jgi:hypothetical protein|nr:hypothetical protein [Bacteroidia bacterium]
MKLIRFVPALVLLVSLFAGCKDDELVRVPCDGSSPTWNGEVFEIIAATCLGSNCHSAGSARGDYTEYSRILPSLQDNSFEIAVLENRTMPQDGTLPDSSLAVLQCWLENGFPEN